jgi:hypothetical protein
VIRPSPGPDGDPGAVKLAGQASIPSRRSAGVRHAVADLGKLVIDPVDGSDAGRVHGPVDDRLGHPQQVGHRLLPTLSCLVGGGFLHLRRRQACAASQISATAHPAVDAGRSPQPRAFTGAAPSA